MIEAFVTGIVDNWPNQLRKYRRLFVVSTIIVIFLLSLPMITEVQMSRQIGLLIIYI
jgi:solute carrier family 6 GABA transporter-like protein 1